MCIYIIGTSAHWYTRQSHDLRVRCIADSIFSLLLLLLVLHLIILKTVRTHNASWSKVMITYWIWDCTIKRKVLRSAGLVQAEAGNTVRHRLETDGGRPRFNPPPPESAGRGYYQYGVGINLKTAEIHASLIILIHCCWVWQTCLSRRLALACYVSVTRPSNETTRPPRFYKGHDLRDFTFNTSPRCASPIFCSSGCSASHATEEGAGNTVHPVLGLAQQD